MSREDGPDVTDGVGPEVPQNKGLVGPGNPGTDPDPSLPLKPTSRSVGSPRPLFSFLSQVYRTSPSQSDCGGPTPGRTTRAVSPVTRNTTTPTPWNQVIGVKSTEFRPSRPGTLNPRGHRDWSLRRERPREPDPEPRGEERDHDNSRPSEYDRSPWTGTGVP